MVLDHVTGEEPDDVGADNFLNRFKQDCNDVQSSDDSEGSDSGDGSSVPADMGYTKLSVSGLQALPGSWEVPICQNCGEEEGPEGGGRYGFDEHDGLFYCGTCWKQWDPNYRAEIMKPAYQQKSCRGPGLQDKDQDPGNFFSAYQAGEGSDSLEGAWNPDEHRPAGDGDQALPGSWERPLCTQCGEDEGDHGGGRYGHGPEEDKFFCGRCWQSWDEADQCRMMRAYAPPHRPHHGMGAFLDCPPPPMPHFADDAYGLRGEDVEDQDEEGWDDDYYEEGGEEEPLQDEDEALDEDDEQVLEESVDAHPEITR